MVLIVKPYMLSFSYGKDSLCNPNKTYFTKKKQLIIGSYTKEQL